MNPPFTHLVLTRFNTSIGFAPSRPGLDRDYLERRLLLFDTYCFPSIAGQTNTNFKWLIFCDAESPQWFRDRIASYNSGVVPVYIDGPATDEVLVKTVQESGLVQSRFLITTRLDNDDALASDHLDRVQRAFRGQDREFVEFPFGLQSYRGHLYNVFWSGSPFLSLIESVSPEGAFTTVLCVEHARVHTAGRVKAIYTRPQWVQVIHGSNIANSLRGWPRLASSDPANFTLRWPADVPAESLVRRCLHAGTALVNRARTLVRRRRAQRLPRKDV